MFCLLKSSYTSQNIQLRFLFLSSTSFLLSETAWCTDSRKSHSSFLKAHFDFSGKQLRDFFLFLKTKMLSEQARHANSTVVLLGIKKKNIEVPPLNSQTMKKKYWKRGGSIQFPFVSGMCCVMYVSLFWRIFMQEGEVTWCKQNNDWQWWDPSTKIKSANVRQEKKCTEHVALAHQTQKHRT